MAAIESLGLGSGVLTNDLVEKLIGAERELSDKRFERDEKIIDGLKKPLPVVTPEAQKAS